MRGSKHKKTQEVVQRVMVLSGFGLTAEQISTIEKIPLRTLHRYYKEEMAQGRDNAIGNVTKTAYQMAMSGKVPAMTMFWLKTRARWREVHTVEHSGPEGGPIETKQNLEFETQWRALPEPKEEG